MKGLFIKDLRLLVNQKKTLLFFLAMMAIFMFTMENGLFIINYITFFGAIIAIGTLSYDEVNNGMTFMFTLPVSRREYVLEKYLFCLIVGVCVWVIAVAASFGLMNSRGLIGDLSESLLESVTGPILAVLMISIMLPLQLKLGQEKSRTGIFIIAGIIAAVFAILKLWVAPTDEEMDALLSGVQNLGLPQGMLIAAAITLLLLVASFFISVRIITRKEY